MLTACQVDMQYSRFEGNHALGSGGALYAEVSLVASKGCCTGGTYSFELAKQQHREAVVVILFLRCVGATI